MQSILLNRLGGSSGSGSLQSRLPEPENGESAMVDGTGENQADGVERLDPDNAGVANQTARLTDDGCGSGKNVLNLSQ